VSATARRRSTTRSITAGWVTAAVPSTVPPPGGVLDKVHSDHRACEQQRLLTRLACRATQVWRRRTAFGGGSGYSLAWIAVASLTVQRRSLIWQATACALRRTHANEVPMHCIHSVGPRGALAARPIQVARVAVSVVRSPRSVTPGARRVRVCARDRQSKGASPPCKAGSPPLSGQDELEVQLGRSSPW
jgi:hypothetical protein